MKDKRKEELLVYEQILFGEKPERMYMLDEHNPKPFIEFDEKRGFEFGKFEFVLLF